MFVTHIISVTPLRRFVIAMLSLMVAIALGGLAFGQTLQENADIDPRLVKLTEIIEVRARKANSNPIPSNHSVRDATSLELIDKLQNASFSLDANKLNEAVNEFKANYRAGGPLDLEAVPEIYLHYSKLLNSNSTLPELQKNISEFSAQGNWFEKYLASLLAVTLYSNAGERQAALQKAQFALSLIPTKPNPQNTAYVTYAKEKILLFIAYLHNRQGNSELALVTSLKFLELTQGYADPEEDVDLINNLIYAYSLGRNHDAQLYLSKRLLEIEKTQNSSVPGISDLRVAGVMNAVGRFERAKEHAVRAQEITQHPTVLRFSRVNEAIALAGLGETDKAKSIAKLAGVNLSPEHILETETREGDLYLAFLLAQTEDPKYATQIYNRQLDVKAQTFLADNSRDTTAMLAELENSQQRQAERDAAAARESQLQAATIARQRILNRTLMVLSAILGLAAFLGILFTRYRGRVLRKLEIKTKEAASAEKLKTEFLGMISHELRTPLNGIIGISDFLANYHEDEDIRQKTGIVLKSGHELLAVVESLTDMARIDAGQFTLLPDDVDLGAALARIPAQWTEKAEEKDLTFTAFIDPKIDRYHMDKERVLQCIDILLSNAIRFTESGRVHLHITAADPDPKSLTVIVADTGQGMSELVQSRLFKPFMQADTSRRRTHMGTGLSLAIAYALAEMMEGRLEVMSREGRGSEFTLTLPLIPCKNVPSSMAEPAREFAEDSGLKIQTDEAVASAEIVEVQKSEAKSDQAILDQIVSDGPDAPTRDYVDLMQPAPLQRQSLHGATNESPSETPKTMSRPLRILIVDDLNSNRDILRVILESKGHICKEAADGNLALSILDRQSFDLIIMDIHMAPMDGVEAIMRIRTSETHYTYVPIIALSADSDPQTKADCLKAGANLFLAKPVKQAELWESIEVLTQSERPHILSRIA